MLGASIAKIIGSFSRKYIVLVLIAALPAIGLSWYGMRNWLQDFAYRVDIGPVVFLIAILGAITIAFITVSYHALKAGFTNPVESLKEE